MSFWVELLNGKEVCVPGDLKSWVNSMRTLSAEGSSEGWSEGWLEFTTALPPHQYTLIPYRAIARIYER